MKVNIGRLTTVRESKVNFYESSDGKIFMTIDQLAKALEYKDKSGVEKIVQRNEYLKDSEFSTTDKLQAPNGKSYKTMLLNKRGITAVTSMSYRPLEIKNKVLSLLGGEIKTHNHFKSRDEDEYIHLIQTTFKLFNHEREVTIGDYRCDLLFSEHRLIVECDEYGHQGYDEALEVKREMYLKSKGYDLIRFNPNSEDFYIGDTLSSILEHLMNTNDFKKQNNEEEELCS